jgi:hypothetical protein
MAKGKWIFFISQKKSKFFLCRKEFAESPSVTTPSRRPRKSKRAPNGSLVAPAARSSHSSRKRRSPKPSHLPLAAAHGRRPRHSPAAARPPPFQPLQTPAPPPRALPFLHRRRRLPASPRRGHRRRSHRRGGAVTAAADPRRGRGAAVRPGHAGRDLRGGAGDGGRGAGLAQQPQPPPRGLPHGHALLRALHAHAPLLRVRHAEARGGGGAHHRERARVLRRKGGDARR